ncbi:Histone-fold protein [Akanthomyces lecanii RCEF 1005]|uniref:Histone-fold protein n=1 Tax=Akanthomyces lecanii RCEF 1005 TaxID=1081108 RepID=A0A168K2N5_CORDF|nr:Histone-fold protein [Akanthomyces lecanii RCEF 1005]
MIKFFAQQTARGGPQQLRKGVAGKTIGARRSRKIVKDAVYGVTRPAIRRLARRGGVKRMSATIYEETRKVLKDHLTEVLYALQKMGRTLYGFDPAMGHLVVDKAHRRHKQIVLRH